MASTALLLAACGQSVDQPAASNAADFAARAVSIAQSSSIVDTRIEVSYRLHGKPGDISQRTSDGDFDYAAK